MSRFGRLFRCLLALAVLIAGMCLEQIKADSILVCPNSPVASQRQVYGTLTLQDYDAAGAKITARAPLSGHPEGGLQEQQVGPQQIPALCGRVLPVQRSRCEARPGPTLRSVYQRVLSGASWVFIVSYIQCQGGTTAGTITDGSI